MNSTSSQNGMTATTPLAQRVSTARAAVLGTRANLTPADVRSGLMRAYAGEDGAISDHRTSPQILVANANGAEGLSAAHVSLIAVIDEAAAAINARLSGLRTVRTDTIAEEVEATKGSIALLLDLIQAETRRTPVRVAYVNRLHTLLAGKPAGHDSQLAQLEHILVPEYRKPASTRLVFVPSAYQSVLADIKLIQTRAGSIRHAIDSYTALSEPTGVERALASLSSLDRNVGDLREVLTEQGIPIESLHESEWLLCKTDPNKPEDQTLGDVLDQIDQLTSATSRSRLAAAGSALLSVVTDEAKALEALLNPVITGAGKPPPPTTYPLVILADAKILLLLRRITTNLQALVK